MNNTQRTTLLEIDAAGAHDGADYVKISNYSILMRLPKDDKYYYKKLLEQFADIVQELNPEIELVEYGKQFIGAQHCIELTHEKCTGYERKHFNTAKELLCYVEGFVAAHTHKDGGFIL